MHDSVPITPSKLHLDLAPSYVSKCAVTDRAWIKRDHIWWNWRKLPRSLDWWHVKLFNRISIWLRRNCRQKSVWHALRHRQNTQCTEKARMEWQIFKHYFGKPQSLDTTAFRRNCCQKIDMQPDWTSIHIWCSCCCCFFFTSISFHYIEINTDAVSFFWPVMVNWFYSNCFLRNIYAVQYTLVKQLLVYNMVNFTPIASLA